MQYDHHPHCTDCLAYLASYADYRAGFRDVRLDERGQLHFDAASRIAADWPLLQAQWVRDDIAEWREYAARGESEVLVQLRAERSLCREHFGEDGGYGSEYVLELDRDPMIGWE